jgi:hypothetical protein
MSRYVHKRFRRLAIYVSEQACVALPYRQLGCVPLTAHYSTYLRGPSFEGIHSLNIYLTNRAAESGRVEKIVVGYLDYYLLVDFQLLAQLPTDQQRQHYLLASLQEAVRQFVPQQGWEITRFEQAYQACLGSDLPVTISY